MYQGKFRPKSEYKLTEQKIPKNLSFRNRSIKWAVLKNLKKFQSFLYTDTIIIAISVISGKQKAILPIQRESFHFAQNTN